jgi:acyl carrier protein
MSELIAPTPSRAADAALLLELAELVVSALNLEVAAADIEADAPLYGDGLGLDSIDILEMQLRAGDEENHAIFLSLRSLGDHVATHRTK